MFDKNNIIEEYERYLKDVRVIKTQRSISENSIKASYLPFVRGKRIGPLLQEASQKATGSQDFFSSFFEGSKETKGRLLELLDGEVFPIKPKNKNESNNKSYLRAFVDYLNYVFDNTPEDCTDYPDVKGYPDIKLDHKTILNRFISRFRTQDRVYDQIMFPCRVFGKLFDRKRYRDLLVETCDRIRFRKKQGDFVEFRDIKSLLVKNGVVSVEDDSGLRPVVTERFDENKKSKGFFPFPKPSFRNFSIDHQLSLNGMMTNSSFPWLSKLTSQIHDLEKQLGSYSYKTAPKIGDQLKGRVSPEEIEKLFDEVTRIYKETTFFIMDQGENSRKNNSV